MVKRQKITTKELLALRKLRGEKGGGGLPSLATRYFKSLSLETTKKFKDFSFKSFERVEKGEKGEKGGNHHHKQ